MERGPQSAYHAMVHLREAPRLSPPVPATSIPAITLGVVSGWSVMTGRRLAFPTTSGSPKPGRVCCPVKATESEETRERRPGPAEPVSRGECAPDGPVSVTISPPVAVDGAGAL